MKIFVFLFLIPLLEVSSVLGQFPSVIQVDSESIANQLKQDAGAYCEHRCRREGDCIRDPGRRTLERCQNDLYRVYLHNYQVCAEACRNRPQCGGSLEKCGCRDACRDRAFEIIRKDNKSPKELIETLYDLRNNPSKYQSATTGWYDYIR